MSRAPAGSGSGLPGLPRAFGFPAWLPQHARDHVAFSFSQQLCSSWNQLLEVLVLTPHHLATCTHRWDFFLCTEIWQTAQGCFEGTPLQLQGLAQARSEWNLQVGVSEPAGPGGSAGHSQSVGAPRLGPRRLSAAVRVLPAVGLPDGGSLPCRFSRNEGLIKVKWPGPLSRERVAFGNVGRCDSVRL